MKKTMICYANWQMLNDWRNTNPNMRVYNNNRLQRAKIDKRLFVLVQVSWSLSTYTMRRLRGEEIAEVIWLGNTRETLPSDTDTFTEIMSLLPFKFDANKKLPERVSIAD
jgi:hypothetical protein